MKTFITFLFICLSALSLRAQTYISPLLGFDLTKLENKYSGSADDYLVILEKGYRIESISIGYKITQIVTENIFISLLFKYSHHNAKADRANFFNIEGIKYNYFYNNLSIGYSFSGFYVGSGLSYNLIGNLKHSYQTSGAKYQTNEKGIMIYVGKEISRLDLELYYYNGLSSSNIKNFDLYLNPISSFGLNLSYPIIVFESSKKDKNCPKF